MLPGTYTNKVYREDPHHTVLSWKVESDLFGPIGSHVTVASDFLCNEVIINRTVDLLAMQMKKSLIRSLQQNGIIVSHDSNI